MARRLRTALTSNAKPGDGASSGDARIRLYSTAVVAAIILGVVLGAIGAERRGDTYGGDYPAFYGAGSIAASGDWDQLYDLGRQVDAQRGLGGDAGSSDARFFAYPPQVAFVYEPLAGLSYLPSYLVHTALMVLLLLASLLLARPMLSWLQGRLALGMAAALTFWPMFRTTTGGSNTALTVFLVVAAWRLVYEDKQLVAGLALAGLLYKPQFAVPLVGLFVLGRYWRVVAGAVGGAVVFYLWGVALRGLGWVGEWLDVAARFGRTDAQINGHSAISFIGFAENLFGVGHSPAVVVAWMLAGATALLLAWMWLRSPGGDLDRLLAATMPGLLLLSLHAMSHDGAAVVVTAGVAASVWDRDRWLPWVVVVWVLGASQTLIRQIGWSPGFPMLLLVMWWGWQLARTARSLPGARADDAIGV
jgi:hypothetical protein